MNFHQPFTSDNIHPMCVRAMCASMYICYLSLSKGLPRCTCAGIAKTLQALLEDSDWLVRERTANALTIIARTFDLHPQYSYHHSPLLHVQ